MFFFMILNYILLTLSATGLAIIGLNHYFQLGFFGMAPIKLDIFISLIYVAAETLVMFFFVGTGVSIKEYIALVFNFFMLTFILYSITYAHGN